ncbi:phytoene desaturase family protein [Foetidibacter luteolus]|uniref:phytoene desaturase family protein n=1 Tax=Foetidibacter luteolus TaxID=2608880 RepID=UPI00129A8A66|nr:phytoene desaturase family protein [Foetidibacter luteolus]
MNKAIVIGSGFAGLSASCFLAQAGWQVTVLEKHATPGGRARQLSEQGFTFDMGPSWYWMPGVFEHFFGCFGRKVSDYYSLTRLDPSYRVYWSNGPVDIPAGYKELQELFNSIEPGSGLQLDKFLQEAEYKYEVGMNKLVYKPGRSLSEFMDADVIKGITKLDIFSSMKRHIGHYFKNPMLRQLMEFPVLFLGALPEKTPALYSLMNYADIVGGTWYPEGGMYSIVKAMHSLAEELGVQFRFNESVKSIQVNNKKASGVATSNCMPGSVHYYDADVVIGGADYHHVEQQLLPQAYRTYTPAYWDKRVMAPGCLIYYIGLNKKLNNIRHHNLFFDTSFEEHGKEIYISKQWPRNPLFYVSVTSVTDNTVAPAGCENLFILIPVAAGLDDDTEARREHYLDMVLKRMEHHLNQTITNSIIYKRSFAHSDFTSEYNAFKGNAYGLANTLAQTAILKPSCKSSKVKNLYYTGQLTVPGPGVPPSLISGEVVAGEILKAYSKG